MQTRPFGATGAPVAVIGQGTWNLESDARADAIRALRAGLDLGMNHVDTAEMYGRGAVEELIAEAIEGRRREVFLASKVLPQNASREGTVRACERSLKRLRTDYLDLYLLHWPGSHPLEATIAGFEQLVSDGKIRAYGVSNFDAEDLERAIAIAGEGRIACDQVLYHLLAREPEAELEPLCARKKVALVGYSPFGSGRAPSAKRAKVLDEIARAHGVTAHQVTLAFLIRRAPLFAIPKSGNVEHVQQNGAAASLALTTDELARLDAAF